MTGKLPASGTHGASPEPTMLHAQLRPPLLPSPTVSSAQALKASERLPPSLEGGISKGQLYHLAKRERAP